MRGTIIPPTATSIRLRCLLAVRSDAYELTGEHCLRLLHCRSLLVHGPVVCGAGVIFQGDAVIHNHTSSPVKLKAGTHEGTMSVGG